ncbi:MAG: hypothetical protein HUJ80_01010 [Firmicutes bacterium]|nr:hypothetical protein [Bacillota bacterium]
MKNVRKYVSLLLCAVLLVAGSVAGTLAYLKDSTDTVTNTFTVGNVEFDEEDDELAGGLDEVKVDEYGVVDDTATKRVLENSYKLIPGHTYVKDPTVHIASTSEPAIVFVEVVDAIADIEDTTTVAAQMTAKGWAQIDTDSNIWCKMDGNKPAKVAAGADLVVFENFTIKSDVTESDLEAYKGKTITIKAFAVQYDGWDLDTDTAADIYAAAF